MGRRDGDLAVPECAKQPRSGREDEARSWGGWVGLREPLPRGGAESEFPRLSRQSVRGPSRRLLGKWLPLPTRQGGPGRPNQES